MKRFSNLIALATLALSLSGMAQASETKAAKPDLAAGEAKATAVCAACHAADGSRGAPTFPILQGQHPEYIVKQLNEFKAGKRKNPVMNGMVATLTPEEMTNVAAFYASKKAKDGAAKNKDLVAIGEKIYRGGITKKTVPACAACHGPNGSGLPVQYPRLAGQHADYTKAQLIAFRQGERTNSPQMATIAANLSDKEIEALADLHCRACADPLEPRAPAPVNRQQARWSDAVELVASMRFAIALLTVICIVSAIGTVIRQGEPLTNYVEQFGPFWADAFGALGLYRIYSTPWFLLILAFLVVSTSLCIARNAPKILADWRTHKEHIREQALQSFHHKASGVVSQGLDAAAQGVAQTLALSGWTLKSQRRDEASGGAGIMIGARHGAANKLGYIAAHSAIVLICLGGLFDGELIVKVQAWAQGLTHFRGGQSTENSKLSMSNPAYRAQLFVSEGQKSNAAVLTLDKGMLLQPLPFEIELKKFTVDYYATGMPKRFASDIVIHDPKAAQPKAFTVEVNHPVNYAGVTIFQSSFEDGGSLVRLKPLLLNGQQASEGLVDAVVNGPAVQLPATWWAARQAGSADLIGLSLEVTDLRVINVEDLAQAQSATPPADKGTSDLRGVNLAELSKHLGSGAKGAGDKKLTNLGPAVTYKLRDAAGQAREYQNYMVPVNLDGQSVFLLGVRDTLAEGFRYLRVPADENFKLDGWLRLRQALADADARALAAQRFATSVASKDRPELREQLTVSAQRALDLFAGAGPAPKGQQEQAADAPNGGLVAISRFIEAVVPPAEREHTSATLIRILNGALFELLNLSRERASLPVLSPDSETVRAFMTQSVLSLSDAVFYPVPLILTLDGFEQRQASVFQVTRTPGRNVVYLGCLLLVVGVFAMLYIRERRLWVWLQADGPGATKLSMALSSTRQTLDLDREFDQLRAALLPDQGR